MSTKRKPGPVDGTGKRNRRVIDLETKIKVVAQSEAGRKVKEIAQDLALPHSTVSTIVKDKDRIHKAVKGCAPMGTTVLHKQRLGHINEMEKLLVLWIHEQTQNLVPLSSAAIKAKSKSILRSLREKDGDDSPCTFRASSGWFTKFKKRFSLDNDGVAEAATDMDASDSYIDDLNVLLRSEGYLSGRVCNTGRAEPFWKTMAGRTYNQEILDEVTSVPNVKVEFDVEEQPVQKQFTSEGLAEALSLVGKGLAMLAGMDSDEERFASAERQITECLRCYQEIYDERMKRTDQSIQSKNIKSMLHADLIGHGAESSSESVLG